MKKYLCFVQDGFESFPTFELHQVSAQATQIKHRTRNNFITFNRKIYLIFLFNGFIITSLTYQITTDQLLGFNGHSLSLSVKGLN